MVGQLFPIRKRRRECGPLDYSHSFQIIEHINRNGASGILGSYYFSWFNFVYAFIMIGKVFEIEAGFLLIAKICM